MAVYIGCVPTSGTDVCIFVHSLHNEYHGSFLEYTIVISARIFVTLYKSGTCINLLALGK